MTAPGAVVYDPEPTVMVGGELMNPAPPPGGTTAGLVAVGALRVVWGTDEPLDQPPPAVASLSLLDFTRTWATTREVIGLPVVLSWTSTLMTKTMFRGRVTGLELTRVQVRQADGTSVPAVRLDLDCSSVEVDLANRYPTETSWPAETVAARAARIAAYCVGVADTVTIRSHWASTTAAAVPDAAQRPIRDLLVQLYNSTGGDRMIYSPERLSYEWLGRPVFDARSVQRLFVGAAGTAREGMGTWAGPDVTATATGVDLTTPGTLYLDADAVEYDEGLTRQASSRITRAVVTSVEQNTGATLTTVRVDPNADEAVIGVRAVTLDSLHRDNSYASLNADDLRAMATQEGAAWRPGRMRWDTRRAGGFHLHALAAMLLRGHATGYVLSINGSWPAAYGIRPVFRVTGGVITYEGGADRGWVVEFDCAGVATYGGGNATPYPVKQHAVTFEEIDDGTTANEIQWWDGDHPRGMHESLTFEDLGYVGRGFGATTIGPDTGWDTA